jgi:tetraprenyl-beta-curcumene synthase
MQPSKIDEPALVWAFSSAACRYWLHVFPQVRRELRHWRRLARQIPDPVLRHDAIWSLVEKHRNAEGAAAFATLAPRRHRRSVVRLLVAFQSMFDYLDTLSEQAANDPLANSQLLHQALTVALDPVAAHVDYYRLHLRHDDGGFLRAYVDACRAVVITLPRYEAVATAVHAAVTLAADGQSLNHAGLYGSHDALAQWAVQQVPTSTGLRWWEIASAAVSTLTIHALLAEAADRGITPEGAMQVTDAYFPWITGLGTLLDSLVDQPEDVVTGNHSQVGHYHSDDEAAERLGAITARSVALARDLRHGDQHTVILLGMVCYYLATPEAALPQARQVTESVLDALGVLSKPALLVFRIREAATGLLRLG